MHKLLICVLGVALNGLFLGLNAQEANRILFNQDWKFKFVEGEGHAALQYEQVKDYILPTGNKFVHFGQPAKQPEQPFNGGQAIAETTSQYDDSKWRTLNLPHDWGVEGEFKQEYQSATGKLPWWGKAWYRKTFTVPATDQGKGIYLDLDGAMSYATVFCNGKLAGGWAYGYSSFRIDLTPYIQYGADNVVSVHLDNVQASSRWYPGGGIYRNVWLVKKEPISIAHWGSYVTTPQVSQDRATVKLELTLQNTTRSADLSQPITVRTTIHDTKVSNVVTVQETQLKHVPDGQTLIQEFILSKPNLWDIEAPNLYVAETQILQNGVAIDNYKTNFGIRSIQFTASDGFHLNGRRVQLNGVCMHHDLGALGSAFNIHAMKRQLVILKEMGTNAIRTAHNPPAPEMLDLCDQMGFLVIDEFTDTWTQAKTRNGYARLFNDWHEQDLRALIHRDRNHPSVIIWSTGNEIAEQVNPDLFWISQLLTDIVHHADPSRLATFGCDRPNASSNGFAKTGDVYGFNYKPRLYEEFHAANPAIPFIGSETSSCVSTRGEYFFPLTYEKDKGQSHFQMSSYDLFAPAWAMAPDWEFKGLDENPQAGGEFVWTGFDYLGEPTPYNSDLTILTNFSDPVERAEAEKQLAELGRIPTPSRSSYFGIVDLAGFPKDRYYLYQSRWRPDLPMAHILPHWTWPERVGEVTPVHVYTSGDAAELFVNGVSQGLRHKIAPEKAPRLSEIIRNPELIKDIYRLCWDDVVYQNGEVKVVAYKNGEEWATSSVQTAGKAAVMQLSTDKNTLSSKEDDLIFVTVRLTDKNGVFAPRSNNLIKFTVEGAAVIEATDNGDPTSHASFKNYDIKAFNGCALVILKSNGKTGEIRLTAKSAGLKTQSIKLLAK